MKTETSEFAPLEVERATELQEIINRAARDKRAVILDPDEDGVAGSAPAELISPNENTNALVRYQRHY